MRTVRTVAVVLLAVLTTACTTQLGDLTVASSKNVVHDFEILAKNVRGEDCSKILMLLVIPIPLGSLQPSIDEAMDGALETVPGADIMTNLTLTIEQFAIPLIVINYVEGCYVVEGDVGRVR